MFKSKHSYIELFEGIIIGGSLAAAATFLFGTKKGKAVQKELVRKYKKFGHITHEMKEKFDRTIHTQVAKATRKVKKAKKVAKKKVKAIKHAVEKKAA